MRNCHNFMLSKKLYLQAMFDKIPLKRFNIFWNAYYPERIDQDIEEDAWDACWASLHVDHAKFSILTCPYCKANLHNCESCAYGRRNGNCPEADSGFVDAMKFWDILIQEYYYE